MQLDRNGIATGRGSRGLAVGGPESEFIAIPLQVTTADVVERAVGPALQ
jgi:hypothetical protein